MYGTFSEIAIIYNNLMSDPLYSWNINMLKAIKKAGLLMKY